MLVFDIGKHADDTAPIYLTASATAREIHETYVMGTFFELGKDKAAKGEGWAPPFNKPYQQAWRPNLENMATLDENLNIL